MLKTISDGKKPSKSSMIRRNNGKNIFSMVKKPIQPSMIRRNYVKKMLIVKNREIVNCSNCDCSKPVF